MLVLTKLWNSTCVVSGIRTVVNTSKNKKKIVIIIIIIMIIKIINDRAKHSSSLLRISYICIQYNNACAHATCLGNNRFIHQLKSSGVLADAFNYSMINLYTYRRGSLIKSYIGFLLWCCEFRFLFVSLLDIFFSDLCYKYIYAFL